MEQVLEKEVKQPSSFFKNGKFDLEAKRKMTPEQQFAYIQLHKEEILASVKALDERLSKCEVLISDEDEIVDLVSKYRRERYEESHHY